MKNSGQSVPISIVIPTYGREQALIDTIRSLLDLEVKPAQIIVVDQSSSHQPDITQQLAQWHQDELINLLTLTEPSIPHAMNTGLLQATQTIVLFVDDDIKAHQHFVKVHYDAHQQIQNLIVAGKVIQTLG